MENITYRITYFYVECLYLLVALVSKNNPKKKNDSCMKDEKEGNNYFLLSEFFFAVFNFKYFVRSKSIFLVYLMTYES